MDPVTHFLVGTGIAELSGEKLSLANPVYLATIIGSVAPDMDVVYQLRGHISYLKNHRGFSHSIPGLLIGAAAIAVSLYLFFPSQSIGSLFLWALIGGISHTVMDVLNSYGAQIFWPVSRKKFSLNLLVLFDPVIVLLFIAAVVWPGEPKRVAIAIMGFVILYIALRMYMRYSVYFYLKDLYKKQDILKIIVMPAMVSLWKWSFLIETKSKYIVGEACWFSFETGIKRVLEKVPHNQIVNAALHSRIGRLFRNFTPYYHIQYYQDGENHIVCFADLRYFVRNDFLHNATIVMSKECEIAEEVFQPYSKNHKLSF